MNQEEIDTNQARIITASILTVIPSFFCPTQLPHHSHHDYGNLFRAKEGSKEKPTHTLISAEEGFSLKNLRNKQ
jgi:hypothetical protein